MNRQTCNHISSVVDEYCKTIEDTLKKEGLNLSVSVGSGSFGRTDCSLKIIFADKDTDGHAVTAEAENFRMNAHLYNMKPEWLFKTFTDPTSLECYQIMGMGSRRCKNRFRIKRLSDNKVFRCGADYVLAAEKRLNKK